MVNQYNSNIHNKFIAKVKGHFNVKERLRDFLALISSNLITTLTYILMDNFCPCLMAYSFNKNYLNYLRRLREPGAR